MPVRPLLSCVAPKLITAADFIGWHEGYVAWFGYNNSRGPAVDIPVGSANAFLPPPADRGQPTSFPLSIDRSAVSVPFLPAESVTWTLNGASRTANMASARCAAIAPVTIDAGVGIYIDAARGADDDVRRSANLLADYLHRITGHDFPIVPAPQPDGISLGVDGDFAAYFRWPYTAQVFEPSFRFGKQDYIIATHGGSPPRINIAGSTIEALRSAVWEFLYQLGYRQFFPGPRWEVIPVRPVIEGLRLDIYRRPAYLTRNLHLLPALKASDDTVEGLVRRQSEQTVEWFVRNQVVVKPDGTPATSDSPAWTPGDIAHGRILQFWEEQHGQCAPCELENYVPDPVPCFDRPRLRRKLCLPYAAAVPGLGRLTAYDLALEWAATSDFARRDFLTMGVAESGDWICKADCSEESPADTSYTPSDRAAALASAVARPRQSASANDDRMVGMRAYSLWQPAPARPDVTVERNVLIEIANSYPENVDKLIKDWRYKGARLFGVRDTVMDIDKPSGNTLDRNLPTSGGLAHTDWMRRRVASFHGSGARFYYGPDLGDLWGNLGLSYWLTARALLTAETRDAAWAADDFAERAFGDAAPHVRDYLAAIDSSALPAGVAIGRMYRALSAALPLVLGDPVRRERLRALVVYPRYRELVRECETSPPCAPDSATARIIAGFVYATRSMRMLSTGAIFNYYAPANEAERRALKLNPMPELGVPPTELDDWGAWEARVGAHLESLIAAGAASPRNREVFAESELRLAYHSPDTLVQASIPPLPEDAGVIVTERAKAIRHRGAGHWYTWANGSTPIRCEVRPESTTSGATVRLWARTSAGWVVVNERIVYGDALSIEFPNPYPDHLHRIDVFPYPGASRPYFQPGEGQRCVTVAGFGPDRTTNTFRRPWMFYVPQGTAVVGGAIKRGGADVFLHAWRRGADGAWVGPRVLHIPRDTDHFRFEVEASTEGQVWVFPEIEWYLRNPVLLTVPPQVARWTNEFLLPASVVAADGLAP